MIKRFLSSLVLMFAVVIVSGCNTTPIQNLSGESIPSGLTNQEIVQAIQEAGHVRGWTVHQENDGHLVGELHVRSHFAAVDIHYSTSEYSISYRDSHNLKHRGDSIHKKYNQWVSNLNLDIRRALHKQTL